MAGETLTSTMLRQWWKRRRFAALGFPRPCRAQWVEQRLSWSTSSCPLEQAHVRPGGWVSVRRGQRATDVAGKLSRDPAGLVGPSNPPPSRC